MSYVINKLTAQNYSRALVTYTDSLINKGFAIVDSMVWNMASLDRFLAYNKKAYYDKTLPAFSFPAKSDNLK